MTEEDITGAFIRDLKNNTRTVCFVTGSGEHQIDDTTRDGFSRFKDLLGKDDYQTKSISLLEKAEVPADCTVVVVGGPNGPITSSPKSMRSRNMSRMAGAPCSCWIRR